MKVTVAQTELESAAQTLEFGALTTLNEFGTDDGKGGRVFDFEKLALILRRYERRSAQTPVYLPPPATAALWNPAKAQEIIAARRKICFGEGSVPKCDWNMDDLCQHPGCKTCPGKQKNSGTLSANLQKPFWACPANKYNQIKL